MRTALFLILAILLIYSNFCYPATAKAQSQSVKVTAYVAEHLTYFCQNGKIEVVSNTPLGVSIQKKHGGPFLITLEF